MKAFVFLAICGAAYKPKLPVGIATLDSEPVTLEPICRVWPWHPQCQYPFARYYTAMRSKVTLEPICRVWPWHPQCQYPFARYYTTMRSKGCHSRQPNPPQRIRGSEPGVQLRPSTLVPALAFSLRYYFNNETNTCEKFVYGGCQANGNNFGTLEECRNTCWASLDQHSLETNGAFEVPFWPFNTQPPLFGGTNECWASWLCFMMLKGLTKAAHGTERQQKARRVKLRIQLAPPEECAYSVEAGPCQAYMPRFFYNTLTKTCEQFVYGGCGGNANNFPTFDACEKKCKKVSGVVPRA
ncbi:hypothetical protein HPB51_025510 [Rhipicephalus microplus]|uniref:BPTI/Kunitz inhibitor domain-containing protein n=1 Tax=Rhipicephalus microplus TaxID=6941 RepID=A0A9J6E4V7_RHIMP|nr:hypothetical protein HPB51_025510 [Rhipicephalus microplus]